MPFSAFGVFDGHGGRSVATFASNSLLKAVMGEVDSSSVPLQVGAAQAAVCPHAACLGRRRQRCICCLRLPPLLLVLTAAATAARFCRRCGCCPWLLTAAA